VHSPFEADSTVCMACVEATHRLSSRRTLTPLLKWRCSPAKMDGNGNQVAVQMEQSPNLNHSQPVPAAFVLVCVLSG
jgi:hypothetical protein